jgi:predicted MPP superfamily phosphohydrolase
MHHLLNTPAEMLTGALRELTSSRFFFRVAFFTVVYLVQRFWFLRAWRLTESVGKAGWKILLRCLLIAAVFVLLAAVPDLPFVHLGGYGGMAHGFLSAAAGLWLAASFFALIAVMAVGLLERLSRLPMQALPSARRESFDPARRAFLRYAAFVAGSVPFAATAYGFGMERLKYRIRRVEVPIVDLPERLDGLRIVQLSDIHIGDFMPRSEVRRAVEMANELHADMAVVTGDYITTGSDPIEDCISELSRLRAPLGVWGCNGNHEIYAGVEDLAQRLFHRHGMRLLRQENAELQWRGEKFNLIGVDYQGGHRLFGKQTAMLRGIEPLLRQDIPNILLSHNPNSFYRAAELGIQLSLAGHTHGGQVRIEIVDHDWSPARFVTKFVSGMYHLPSGGDERPTQDDLTAIDRKPAALYVNCGLGTIGMPVRLGVPPEITLLTLRSAA